MFDFAHMAQLVVLDPALDGVEAADPPDPAALADANPGGDAAPRGARRH